MAVAPASNWITCSPAHLLQQRLAIVYGAFPLLDRGSHASDGGRQVPLLLPMLLCSALSPACRAALKLSADQQRVQMNEINAPPTGQPGLPSMQTSADQELGCCSAHHRSNS